MSGTKKSSNASSKKEEDLYGAEYAAILKNIYALAAGLASGLGQLIGHGCTVKSALNEMTMIAEGYYHQSQTQGKNAYSRHGVRGPLREQVAEKGHEGTCRHARQGIVTFFSWVRQRPSGVPWPYLLEYR